MLLKVGVATIAVSLVLAAGVAAAVGLRDEIAETVISTEPGAAAEPPVQKRKFDPGQRLEIDDEANGDEEVPKLGDGNADEAKPSERVQPAGEAVPEDSEPASPPAPRPRVKSAPTPAARATWPQVAGSEAVRGSGEAGGDGDTSARILL